MLWGIGYFGKYGHFELACALGLKTDRGYEEWGFDMSKLKPQLIITGSNKKKSGFASGIGYFILLVIVFVIGVYVGMRLDSADLNEDLFSRNLNSDVPEVQNIAEESEKAVLDVVQQKEVNTNVQDVPTQSVSENNTDKIADTNLEINSEDQGTELVDDTSMASSSDALTETTNNESSFEEGGLAATNSPTEDSYRLQVAAFGNLDDANGFVSQLKLKGYDAYIVTMPNSRGEVWNLIKVGNFKTAQEAWNLSAMYQNKEGGEVFVESLNRGRVYKESLEEKLEENNDQQE